MKPFHFEFSPFVWDDYTSIRIIGYDANTLCNLLLNLVELSSIDSNDFMAVEETVSRLIERWNFFYGYQAKCEAVKIPYIEGPGTASREAGQWTMDAAYNVLEKYGGYLEYKALPRGEKKHVTEKIQEKLKAKDIRNVHNIINKSGALSKKEN